ncbi:Tn3 transposase DDE domain-containing protein [Nonomuraea fuscirosea]|uniref:Tn3 transposase DDE domain-containing protein n=1 Tax=Nonomuraea fuscirosea TaxID=1291556 RepID=A0A2T0LVW2_9ACTN|nr:Tn3 transposase DDE domain-containing protein [Nonomuraea fuscirosea]
MRIVPAELAELMDAQRFTADLIEEMDAELSALHDALPGLDWQQIAERKKGGAIQLTPLEPLPEPRNLRKLKAAIRARWGVVPLLDMFTETALRTGCLDPLTSAGVRIDLDPQEVLERMLLVIYAYGTGAGIRSVAAGEHPYSEDDLRYAAAWCLSVAGAREVARVNYVDSHGASFIGFGITRLLNFDLIARFKQINTMKLYLPGKSDRFAYPLLGPALTRPIRPDIIENNYDLMIK